MCADFVASFFFFSRKFIRGFLSALYGPLVGGLYVLTAFLSVQCQWCILVFKKPEIVNCFLVFFKDWNVDSKDSSVLLYSVFILCGVLGGGKIQGKS